MGDGHHGWAAAEMVLALRDAFVAERWTDNGPQVTLLGGIPAAWFEGDRPFSISRTAVPGGMLQLEARPHAKGLTLEIDLERRTGAEPGQWLLLLPFPVGDIRGAAREYPCHSRSNGEYGVTLTPGSDRLSMTWRAASS